MAAAALHAQIDVGSGAPTEDLARRFVNAYYRNGFYTLVSTPPIGNVSRFGATGLVQEFRDSARTANVRLALVKANATAPEVPGTLDILQVYADLYGYYSTVGVNTAGYPTNDTQPCPPFEGNSCQYQFFDKNHVLFAYKSATTNGQTFTVRDPFYTNWQTSGGINGLGRATDSERSVASFVAAITGTVQRYFNGAIYNITSGTFSGRTLSVAEPVYSYYASLNGHDGALGFPTEAERILPDGRRRQVFQGGSIEYTPGSDPVLRLPVSDVLISPGFSPVRLDLGQTVELRARVLGSNGGELSDRPDSWTTSNGRVAAIQVSNNAVTVRAVGAGSAAITASSEGRSSPPVTILVSAPCCQVGEGAPSTVVQQAFQDAVTRNRLNVVIPAQNPVRRSGAGFVQDLFSATQPGVRYLIAKADSQSLAFVVKGELLTRYEQLGGPGGVPGHPVSDATPGGRQAFERATLAGIPVRSVAGSILVRWATGNYETGPLGSPAGDASYVLSSLATAGSAQEFKGGLVLAISSGSRTGQAYAVSGAILRRFAELGGAAGAFGFPISEEAAFDGKRRQNFEGGYFDYLPGEVAATEHGSDRRPVITAFPEAVPAGSRLRLAIGGFAAGATVRITVTGRPDFSISTPNGAYSWEIYVPADAPSGPVPIRAVDPDRAQLAIAQFTVRSLTEARVDVVKLQGDGQVGAPGAQLPVNLRIAVRDLSGNLLPGTPVRFTPSPGASLVAASTVTDANGLAEASVRLPLSEGIALITAEASRAVATFSVRSAAFRTSAFPAFRQTSTDPVGNGKATIQQKGALLVAVSAILRHYQNRGVATSANGVIDVAAVNAYLRDFCAPDKAGTPVCDGYLWNGDSGDRIVNLWRLPGLLNGQLDVRPVETTADAIRDRIVRGSPVLLALRLTSDGNPAGGHYVVATGIERDGSLLIHDPHPVFARTALSEYNAGFGAAGRLWRGTLAGAVAMEPVVPPASGFLLSSVSQSADRLPSADVFSSSGACGSAVDMPDATVFVPNPLGPPLAAPATGVSRFRYCEGTAPAYQIEAGPAPVIVTDLAAGGRRASANNGVRVSLGASRIDGLLVFGPLAAAVASGGVVNGATFDPAVAPGSLVAIFGAGLASGGRATVTVGGLDTSVLYASPFQVNAVIPFELPAGRHALRVRSEHGVAEVTVDLQESAPAIFMLPGGHGAIFNPDGGVNEAWRPVTRGQYLTLYATGLGAVETIEEVQAVRNPVVVRIAEQTLIPSFAGLAPGYPGVYQINLPIPSGIPPGLDLPLQIEQSGTRSALVAVSLR
jgi:uncharacterized protein (TIGR03437 family)